MSFFINRKSKECTCCLLVSREGYFKYCDKCLRTVCKSCERYKESLHEKTCIDYLYKPIYKTTSKNVYNCTKFNEDDFKLAYQCIRLYNNYFLNTDIVNKIMYIYIEISNILKYDYQPKIDYTSTWWKWSKQRYELNYKKFSFIIKIDQ